MKYYRLALQNRRSAIWYWTTTALTSLHAVMHTLRFYGSLPQDCVRVFIADSKDELHGMLNNENNHLSSGSVTATQFLRDRRLKVNEPEQDIAAQDAPAKNNAVHIEHLSMLVASAPQQGNDHIMQPIVEGSMSYLESKRLSMEMGPGGDRNDSYLFSLPLSTPQLLIWTRLRARVQAGELQP